MVRRRIKPRNRDELVKMMAPGGIGAVKIDIAAFIEKNKGRKDMDDPNNWKSTCEECGGIMDYFNLRYGCRDCGHILEV